VFLLLCGTSIAVACVLVWWLGYTSTLRTVDELSSRVRRVAGVNVRAAVAAQLAEPMDSAFDLAYAARKTFPDVATTGVFTNQTGFLSDLTVLMARRFPSVQQMVIAGGTRFLLAGQRELRSDTPPTNIVYTFGDQRTTLQGNTSDALYAPGSVFIELYLPYRMVPNFANVSSSQDWTLTDPTATANETFEALGPRAISTWYPIPGQPALHIQPWYLRALELNGTLGWTELEVVDGNINYGGQHADRQTTQRRRHGEKARTHGKRNGTMEDTMQ
jgi:hypothetical protein